MNLLTLTLGSLDRIHLESPLLPTTACCTRGFRRYSLMFSRDFVPVAFSVPYHRNIPMDKYMHFPFLLLFRADLVITRYPVILSIDPRISCAYCLAVLCHMNTPTDNSLHLSSIRSSPVVRMLHKILWNTIRSSKNLLQTIALQILVCLHYGGFPYV